jgi:hypothetical protein
MSMGSSHSSVIGKAGDYTQVGFWRERVAVIGSYVGVTI